MTLVGHNKTPCTLSSILLLLLLL